MIILTIFINIFSNNQSNFILHDINQIITNSTMITQISNPNESPRKSDPLNRQIPAQSIIRQVTTPYVLRQAYNNSQPPSFQITNPQPIQIIQNNQQFSQANATLISGRSRIITQQIPLQPRNSNIIQNNQAQFMEGYGSKQSFAVNQNVTHTIPAQLPPLPPIRRVQYIPYEEKYIQYVQQKIKVPVQKTCTDYYRIEHVIDYVQIEKEETVYEIEPKEFVTMRLEYVPVQQKIIHISDKNAKQLGIKQYQSVGENVNLSLPQNNPLYQKIEIVEGNIITSKGGAVINSTQTGGFVSTSFNNAGTASGIRRSRTNFVTSDGYDPQSNLQQIDRILTSSSVRASRAKLQA